MTKKDLFSLIIKVFGLYLALSVFLGALSKIPALMFYDSYDPLLEFVGLAIALFIYIFIISAARQIVELIKIDRGFEDDRVDLGSLTDRSIVKLATFILGAYIIIQNISPLLQHLFALFPREADLTVFTPEPGGLLFSSLLNITIGFALIFSYNKIADFFESVDKDKRKLPEE